MNLLTRQQAADLLAVPERTLADWAYRAVGPPFFRVGRHTRYREDELLAWLEDQRVSTNGDGP